MTVDFADFFREVWGYAPFPWQRRLSEQLLQQGAWPDTLDLPTGSGKTAALDIALHHLAMDPRAARRIILVVDRRVIVDQVGLRARKLRAALEQPPGPASRKVADALRALQGEPGPLLNTAVLRGGTVRDDAWSQRPDIPLLASSTVDQVGSRLLFRGYGVSDSMKPVHAGLIGCDTLLLLDEVHLSRPFADTLAALQRLRRADSPVPARLSMVQLSATPGTATSTPFRLGADDQAHPVLATRLRATKPATLQPVKVKGKAGKDEPDKRAAVAAAASKAARALLKNGRNTVAVVVNRVDTARRTAEQLAAADIPVRLLTGRLRPLDQARLVEEITPRVSADRELTEGEPFVLVATQCIEAGADFDFDGLVTECASLDALRQRFGRLNRRGKREAQATILARTDQIGGSGLKSPDPVYGEALDRTWGWLQSIAEDGKVDFGIDALDPRLAAAGALVDTLKAPHRDAPVVMPPYLDQWVQTRPRPHADPDVSLFLHGIPEDRRAVVPDVQVVWRADLTEEDLGALRDATDAERAARLQSLSDRLRAVPPASQEALTLPPWSLAAWQREDPSKTEQPDLADVERQVEVEPEGRATYRTVLILRDRAVTVVRADEIRPGETAILPATRGGLGRDGTFDPEATDPVEDLGDLVQLLQRGRPVLRLDTRTLPDGAGTPLARLAALEPADDPEEVAREVLHDVVAWLHEHGTPRWQALARAVASTRPRLVDLPDQEGRRLWIGSGRRLDRSQLAQLLGAETEAPTGDQTTEGDDGSFTGAAVPLFTHNEGVGRRARAYATACGLPTALVGALAWAGRLHDVGKVDPRFQLWLHGGDEVSMVGAEEPLAKSAMPWLDRAGRQRAREAAGYARGQRHELVSLDMIEGNEGLEAALQAAGIDVDLVYHLVASHHGWCRPLAPPVDIGPEDDDEARWLVQTDAELIVLSGRTRHQRARLDSGVIDRFWRLVRRYGWHELAYLEAILRLADHRQSEGETP